MGSGVCGGAAAGADGMLGGAAAGVPGGGVLSVALGVGDAGGAVGIAGAGGSAVPGGAGGVPRLPPMLNAGDAGDVPGGTDASVISPCTFSIPGVVAGGTTGSPSTGFGASMPEASSSNS